MMTKLKCTFLAGAAVVAFAGAEQGHAQQSQPESESTASENSGDIIVTARKRAERVQDTPLSITALTSDVIEQRGLVSQEDYLRGLPGVSQSNGPFGSSYNIRGIETDPKGRGTVATYFGETDTTNGKSSVSGLDLKLVDIERVEILRGPQGTSFGAASLGGVIRTIPTPPNLNAFEGKLSAGYSTTARFGGDNFMTQAVLNVPLIADRLAVRAVAYRFDDSGFIHNIAGTSPVLRDYAAQFGAEPAAIDATDIGAQRFTGARISALWQPTDRTKLTLTYLKQKTEGDGFARGGAADPSIEAQANLGPYEQLLYRVAPEHMYRGQESGVQDTDFDLFNASLEQDFGWATLNATISHIKNNGRVAFSFPISFPMSQGANSSDRVTNGEVRLATSFDGPFNFLAGAYAEEYKTKGLFTYYWLGSQALNFFETPTTFLSDSFSEEKTTQKAIFGEVSWKFLSSFTLTAGARHYKYDKDTLTITSGAIFGDATTALSGGDSGTNYKASLSFQPNRDVHVYATWAQGFRLGGPEVGLPENTCDVNPRDGIVDGSNGVTIESTRFIKSDSLNSYELGTKLNLANGKVGVSAAVYRVDWKDLPFLVRAPGSAQSGCGFNYQTNVGSARSEGLELQVNLRPSEAVHIDLAGSLTKAKLTSDVPAQGLSSGDRLPGSPKVNASVGVQFDFSLLGRDASLRADGIYVGKFYGEFGEDPNLAVGDYVKVDLVLSADIAEALGARFYVKNLTNSESFMYKEVGASPLYGFRLRPRTIGVELDYKF